VLLPDHVSGVAKFPAHRSAPFTGLRLTVLTTSLSCSALQQDLRPPQSPPDDLTLNH